MLVYDNFAILHLQTSEMSKLDNAQNKNSITTFSDSLSRNAILRQISQVCCLQRILVNYQDEDLDEKSQIDNKFHDLHSSRFFGPYSFWLRDNSPSSRLPSSLLESSEDELVRHQQPAKCQPPEIWRALSRIMVPFSSSKRRIPAEEASETRCYASRTVSGSR